MINLSKLSTKNKNKGRKSGLKKPPKTRKGIKTLEKPKKSRKTSGRSTKTTVLIESIIIIRKIKKNEKIKNLTKNKIIDKIMKRKIMKSRKIAKMQTRKTGPYTVITVMAAVVYTLTAKMCGKITEKTIAKILKILEVPRGKIKAIQLEIR